MTHFYVTLQVLSKHVHWVPLLRDYSYAMRQSAGIYHIAHVFGAKSVGNRKL